MKTKLILLLLVTVGSMAQSSTNSRTETNRSQRAFLGDVPSTVADSVAEPLKFAEGNFLGVAEVMPENKYDFVPRASLKVR